MSPLEAISGLAVRYLDKKRLLALRAAYFTARTKLYPLMRAIHGTFDSSTLRQHLEERVGSDFDILMVHSSVNHMRPMFTDSPLELVKMLMDFCGPKRTLVMPTFYFGDPDIGGAYATFRKRPQFDLKRVPSQMGLATELFRRMPGVVQSRHPVYRVAALGPQMLRVAGTLADGTATWCVGPKTLRELTIPTLRQAADDAGRPEPRVVCALPVCVTDNVDAARARAAQVFAIYDTLPSYKAMMNREGVDGPGGLAIVGTEAEVRDQIDELKTIGVTDFNAGVFATDPEELARTNSVLHELV